MGVGGSPSVERVTPVRTKPAHRRAGIRGNEVAPQVSLSQRQKVTTLFVPNVPARDFERRGAICLLAIYARTVSRTLRFKYGHNAVVMSKRFELRLPEETLKALDKWRVGQEGVPTRSEAIRQLIERGLSGSDEPMHFSPGEKLVNMRVLIRNGVLFGLFLGSLGDDVTRAD